MRPSESLIVEDGTSFHDGSALDTPPPVRSREDAVAVILREDTAVAQRSKKLSDRMGRLAIDRKGEEISKLEKRRGFCFPPAEAGGASGRKPADFLEFRHRKKRDSNRTGLAYR